MNFKMTFNSMIFRIRRMLNAVIYNKTRIIKYNFLSTCSNVYGSPKKNGPVLLNGSGSIIFGKNVNMGYIDSPYFYNSYIYIEARKSDSKIEIKSGVFFNNNICIISEGAEGITIGANTLIGTGVTIYDSNFHDLDAARRLNGIPKTAGVEIGENVFIGSNVTILKGVKIGDNSIIGNGSVVNSAIPSNVMAAGNPCKVIKSLSL